MREFAQELVDLVIDNVAATINTKDVGTCGSVCRRWRPRSRMHLFSSVTLRNAPSYEEERNRPRHGCSNTDLDTFPLFFDLLDAAPAPAPILSLVRTLLIRIVLHAPWPTEQDMSRLHNCSGLRELRIHGANPMELSQELQFVQLVHTHVPRFGAACPALTVLDLGLPTDLPLNVVADLLSALPFLEELRLRGSRDLGSGIVKQPTMLGAAHKETVPRTDAFPPHLQTLDIALYRGTSLIFEWLLSHSEPPVFTSLTLKGCIGRFDESVAALYSYVRRFGPQIKFLSLGLCVETGRFNRCSFEDTHALEVRVLAYTPELIVLELFMQHSETIPATLLSLPSTHLTTLKVSVHLFRGSHQPEWSLIDSMLATPRFDLLRRVSFTHYMNKNSLLTVEVKELMPQTIARNILV